MAEEIDGLPVYKITIDQEYSEGNELGIDMIAFTDNPAIMTKGMAFNSKVKPLAFKDDVKMRIAAPAMIPMDIYRSDEEDGEYYVSFTEAEIERIHNKFMQGLSNKDLFNLEHEEDKKVPAFILECWLVSEPKLDRSFSTFGVEVPKGTLFVVAQVTDKDYYNSLVENDRTGFSIEGFLGLKLSEINKNKINMESPRFELDGKSYDLIDGVPVEVVLADTEEETEKEKEEELAEEVELEEVVVEAADEEEEVEEMADDEEEKEKEEELDVDPELDAEAVIAIVAPLLEDFKKDVLQILGEMQEENTTEEEVEVEATKLTAAQRFSAFISSN
jgi:hypothetical protein